MFNAALFRPHNFAVIAIIALLAAFATARVRAALDGAGNG